MNSDLTGAEHYLQRIAAGDPDAVRGCLARFTPLVWSIARKLGRDAATIEDLVQEIFIEIWKSAGRYDPSKASEATFIATIARRRIIDHGRRIARSPELELIEESSATSSDAALEGVELEDEARRAKEALALLKPEQRTLILMSVVEGMTHREIATSTGLPLGTVKSHIRRGLDKTARLMRGAEEEQS